MQRDTVLILDFGSQYTQLIARRVREQKVYSEIHPFNLPIARIKEMAPAGIVLSGGPSSVYAPEAPRVDPQIYELGVPILGICYGVQVTALTLGGNVIAADHREYGRAQVKLTTPSELFHGFAVGEDQEAAERRFFAEWSKGVPPPRRAQPNYAAPIRRGPPSGSDVIGLFPEPGQ